MSKTCLEVRDLWKSYGNTPVLQGVEFNAERGSSTALLGPSGSGKTTLLRCINRMEEPDRGRIWIEDCEVTAPNAPLDSLRSRIGLVYQQFHLFPHLTALGNCTLALRAVRRRSRREALLQGRTALGRLGLAVKADALPHQLSGGQKQRVAIARALALEPRLLMLDEPTSALDPELIQGLVGILRDLTKEGVTLLVVTHHAAFSRQVADRVLRLRTGETGAKPGSGLAAKPG